MQLTDDLEFAPVLKRSAAQDVRARLITLIETGKLAVDSKLPSENDLARSFGVSRPVIREALVGLQALGLTKTLNGRGCYVASRTVATPMLMGQYTPEQLNEVRRCLEVPSARAAAERRSQADLGTLAEIINAMETEEDAYKRNQLDVAFHVAIAHATGNPLFVRLIEELRTVLEEHSRAAATVPGRRSAAVQEHRAVYEAILQRDGEAAARAMAAHVNAADNSFSLLPSGAAPSR